MRAAGNLRKFLRLPLHIRDADVAQTATAFAADQILGSIGTSVLANIKTQAEAIEKLFQ